MSPETHRRPTLTSAAILDVLEKIDARRLKVRLVGEYLGFRSYRVDNGWVLRVYASGGTWRHLDGIVTEDGREHDPWHHLYDDDHRKAAHLFAAVRAFVPARPKAYGLDAPAATAAPRFDARPRVTKNGRRAFC